MLVTTIVVAEFTPLTDLQAHVATRHLTDRAALGYLLGRVDVLGLVECEGCGEWRPALADVAPSAALTVGRCPDHD